MNSRTHTLRKPSLPDVDLFLDLVFVAAIAACSDSFKDNLTLRGAMAFVAQLGIFYGAHVKQRDFCERSI